MRARKLTAAFARTVSEAGKYGDGGGAGLALREAYRYPVDQQGNPLPMVYGELYLPELADVMNGVAGYFTGCDGDLNNR